MTRRVRLAEAAPVPIPASSLVGEMRAADRRGSWWRRLTLARIGLALVGLAQCAISFPDLLTGSYRDAPIHVAHEMGALDLALAVGFLVAAFRPVRAQGMRALVGCAALLLILTAVIDLLAGRTQLSDEAPHLLVLIGWLLLRRTATLMPSGEQDKLTRRPLRTRWSSISLPWNAERPALRPGHPGKGEREPPIRTVDTPGRQAEPRRSAGSG